MVETVAVRTMVAVGIALAMEGTAVAVALAGSAVAKMPTVFELQREVGHSSLAYEHQAVPFWRRSLP